MFGAMWKSEYWEEGESSKYLSLRSLPSELSNFSVSNAKHLGKEFRQSG